MKDPIPFIRRLERALLAARDFLDPFIAAFPGVVPCHSHPCFHIAQINGYLASLGQIDHIFPTDVGEAEPAFHKLTVRGEAFQVQTFYESMDALENPLRGHPPFPRLTGRPEADDVPSATEVRPVQRPSNFLRRDIGVVLSVRVATGTRVDHRAAVSFKVPLKRVMDPQGRLSDLT